MSLFTPVRSTRKDQDSSENAPGFGHRMAPTPVIAMDGKPQLQETTPLNSKAGFSMAGKTRSVRKYNSLEESISSFHAVDSSKYLKIIEELIRARFFTSAEIICELWLSELDVSVKEDIRMKISAFMTFGDIQIHLRNFQLGIDSFDKALELLHSSSSNEIEDLFTDIHGKILRAKLEKMKTSIPHPKDSYKHMEDWDEATQFVQSIPVERRSLEMNMILANGLHALDSFDQAFQTYQKIVHNNPFCIEAALSMFKIKTYFDNFSFDPQHLDNQEVPGVRAFLKGVHSLCNHDYFKAANTFGALSQRYSYSRQSMYLAAMANLYLGYTTPALHILTELWNAFPNSVKGMDALGWVLRCQGNDITLSHLSRTLMSINNSAVESWIVLALYCDIQEKYEEALQSIDVAISIDVNNAFARLVSGCLHFGLAKIHMSESQPEGSLTSQVVNLLKHAATEYRRAFELNAINVGAAQGYVDCLLALRQSKDALLFAQSLYKRFPSNPKIELLLGTILSKSKAPKTLEKAKLLFKNSLKHFRQVKANSTQAVLALSQLMMDCNEGDKAVELLKSQIEFSVSKSNIDAVDLMHLYCKQGDISASIGLQNEAFECYNMAIRSSPTGICDEASQALEQLQEKNSQRRMQLISTGDDYFENQIPSNSFEIPEQSREFSPIIPY